MCHNNQRKVFMLVYQKAFNLIKNYSSLTVPQKQELKNITEELGIKPRTKECYGTKFICPEFSFSLDIPCDLTSCKFNVKAKNCHNCLFSYMEKHGLETLDYKSISYLYKIPIKNVLQTQIESMNKIQSVFLKNSIENRYPIFEFFSKENLCCVCESRIDDNSYRSNYKSKIDFIYCCKECYNEKPPEILFLEDTFKTDISNILKTCFDLFKSINIVLSLLNLSKLQLIHACNNYLNLSYEDCVKQYNLTTKYASLVRRTKRGKYQKPNLLKSLSSFKNMVLEKFGKPSLDFQVLRKDLKLILCNS